VEETYNDIILNQLISNGGDDGITFQEVLDQFPAEWLDRTPEENKKLKQKLKQRFEEMDTDKSGEVDIDEYKN
jgi:hypothetical protein